VHLESAQFSLGNPVVKKLLSAVRHVWRRARTAWRWVRNRLSRRRDPCMRRRLP
jgi:hypothetical protein